MLSIYRQLQIYFIIDYQVWVVKTPYVNCSKSNTSSSQKSTFFIHVCMWYVCYLEDNQVLLFRFFIFFFTNLIYFSNFLFCFDQRMSNFSTHIILFYWKMPTLYSELKVKTQKERVKKKTQHRDAAFVVDISVPMYVYN